jgi:hypothetical protein
LLLIALAVTGAIALTVTVLVSREHSAVGPGTCTEQVAVTFPDEITMLQAQDHLRDVTGIAAVAVLSRREVFQWWLSMYADAGIPEMARLTTVDRFSPTMWLSTDDVSVDELKRLVTERLGEKALSVRADVPCDKISRVARPSFPPTVGLR